jgi:hypothetical protein
MYVLTSSDCLCDMPHLFVDTYELIVTVQNLRGKHFPRCTRLCLGGDFNLCPQTEAQCGYAQFKSLQVFILPRRQHVGLPSTAGTGFMKRCGLRHAFFASGGGAWVPTDKKATLDHVFVSDEACHICAQGLSVSDHHHGPKVTLARSDH